MKRQKRQILVRERNGNGEKGVAFIDTGILIAGVALLVVASVIFMRDRTADRYCDIGGAVSGRAYQWSSAEKKCVLRTEGEGCSEEFPC